MTLGWPALLLATLLIPLGIWASVAIGRRRRATLAARGGLGFGAVTAGRAAASAAARSRARIPAAIVVVGLLILAFAIARPQGVVELPRQVGTVVLAFDVSGSMAANDLQPTRMEAAKAAAKAFVERQPSTVVVGIVAFSDAGVTVQTPTSDQAAVIAAIERLTPTKGTSLANGIQSALEVVAAAENPPATNHYSNRSPAPTPTPTPAPVPAGSDRSATIVLLTDGENNERPDPMVATQAAANAGVRIDTVGIGSPEGSTLDVDGFRIHTQLDEALLQQIADATQGTYYHAADTGQLHAIYDGLDPRLSVSPQTLELTPLFAGAAMILIAAGGLVSLLWIGRLP